MAKTKRKNSHPDRMHSIRMGIFLFVFVGGLLCLLFQSGESTAPAGEETTGNCSWNWAHGEALPQHYETIRTALAEAGYTNYELAVSAYGEDYICLQNDEVVSSQFHIMDITPSIKLNVKADIFDHPSSMGAHIRLIVNGILGATEALPRISRMEIQFVNGDTIQQWSAAPSKFSPTIPLGMTDSGLYDLGKE